MSTLPSGFHSRVAGIVGDPFVLQDAASLHIYGADALKQSHPPDIVVLPGSTQDVSAIAQLCNEERVPLVVRGGGTGYTGGAVPTHGGLVMSLERLNRILEIDELNLLARVQPNVITGDLQDAVERVGLFYPPDPASLRQSALGGNVAECAGGPRAFKYGTTRRYVLALEAVLPTGEIIHTGSKAVKNVVGYDLTQLLIGSEGTLAILTEITRRASYRSRRRVRRLLAEFDDISQAVNAVTAADRAAGRAGRRRDRRRRFVESAGGSRRPGHGDACSRRGAASWKSTAVAEAVGAGTLPGGRRLPRGGCDRCQARGVRSRPRRHLALCGASSQRR